MLLSKDTFTTSFYTLRRISRRLWVRAALIASLGLLAAVSAEPLAPLVQGSIADSFEPSSVAAILDVIASSMLSVTIFSLSVMVATRQSASTQGTPRAQQLLIEDPTTRIVLATFLGAFVFALTGRIAMGTGYYEGGSAAVMLLYTLLVVALIIVAILRWIDHISDLGSVAKTTRQVEAAAQRALDARAVRPCLGAHPLSPDGLEVPNDATAIHAPKSGYLQYLDLDALSDAAEQRQFEIYLMVSPGNLVTEGDLLLRHTSARDERKLLSAITIGDARAFDQDPRFGVIVLSEIAQRALSPGINDPGTAIDVIARLQRLLSKVRDDDLSTASPPLARVWMPPVTLEALMIDGFESIARDGAAVVEVQIRLQKAFAVIGTRDHPALRRVAREAARRALKRAEKALVLDDDIARVRAAATLIDGVSDSPRDAYSAASA